MPKYKIRLSWRKYIELPLIEARNKQRAQKIARDILANESLHEEVEPQERWEIKETRNHQGI